MKRIKAWWIKRKIERRKKRIAENIRLIKRGVRFIREGRGK